MNTNLRTAWLSLILFIAEALVDYQRQHKHFQRDQKIVDKVLAVADPARALVELKFFLDIQGLEDRPLPDRKEQHYFDAEELPERLVLLDIVVEVVQIKNQGVDGGAH
jgi:hypothetical protein